MMSMDTDALGARPAILAGRKLLALKGIKAAAVLVVDGKGKLRVVMGADEGSARRVLSRELKDLRAEVKELQVQLGVE